MVYQIEVKSDIIIIISDKESWGMMKFLFNSKKVQEKADKKLERLSKMIKF